MLSSMLRCERLGWHPDLHAGDGLSDRALKAHARRDARAGAPRSPATLLKTLKGSRAGACGASWRPRRCGLSTDADTTCVGLAGRRVFLWNEPSEASHALYTRKSRKTPPKQRVSNQWIKREQVPLQLLRPRVSVYRAAGDSHWLRSGYSLFQVFATIPAPRPDRDDSRS